METKDPLVQQDPPLAKIPRQWVGIRLAHEAAMLDDANKLLKAQRELAAAHARKTMGDALQPEQEADMIHVGDQVTNVHNPPQLPSAAKAGLSKLATAGLMALALATGAGASAGAMALLPLLFKPSSPAVSEPAKQQPTEWRIRWSVEDGKVKTQVEPIAP